MATTTNYGWTTPDDTALVKDGASAIRTLGSSVDTTTKALNPSTTLGDIEYRSSTANTNTRVGIGSSGQGLTVVAGVPSWAASSTSTLTTTGDTLYASAANTLARRAIGTTGQVLTVAAGIPTWATPSSPALSGVGLTSASTISVANNTATAVTWATEEWDTNSFHSTATNTSRITIPTGAGGYYLFNAQVQCQDTTTANTYRQLILRKNGNAVFTSGVAATACYLAYIPLSAVIYCTAADYFEVFIYQDAGGAAKTWQGIFFQATYLGA